jgi:hypothetical protein
MQCSGGDIKSIIHGRNYRAHSNDTCLRMLMDEDIATVKTSSQAFRQGSH